MFLNFPEGNLGLDSNQTAAIFNAVTPIIQAAEENPGQRDLLHTLLRHGDYEVKPVWALPVLQRPDAFVPLPDAHPAGFIVVDTSQEGFTRVGDVLLSGTIVGGLTWQEAGFI